MNSKSLLLLLAALAVGIVAYYFNLNNKQNSTVSGAHLIPSLEANLNSVNRFTITESGNSVLSEVSKSDNGWIVEGRDGYAANKTAVRILFNNLAEAKTIEAKTSNPENYIKLGVEDVADKNAQGVLFSVEGLGESVNIIFGNEGSSGKNTQYVRHNGEEQTWLINKKLKLNTDVTEWLQKDIFDLPPERIKSVQISHPDSDTVKITNDGEDEYEYKLDAEAPEGLILWESQVYQVANSLSSLQLRDVATFANLDTESIVPVVTVFKTFDGLTITTKAYTIDISKYFTIEVTFSEDDIDHDVVSSEQQTKSSSDAALKSDPEAAKKLAETAKQRLDGWAYLFPTITQEALTKKLEEFFIAPGA